MTKSRSASDGRRKPDKYGTVGTLSLITFGISVSLLIAGSIASWIQADWWRWVVVAGGALLIVSYLSASIYFLANVNLHRIGREFVKTLTHFLISAWKSISFISLTIENPLGNDRVSLADQDRSRLDLDELIERLSPYLNSESPSEKFSLLISEEESGKIESIFRETVAEFIGEKSRTAFSERVGTTAIEDITQLTRKRLSDAIEVLGGRVNQNLSLGVFMGFVGFMIAFWFIWKLPTDASTEQVIVAGIPRLALLVLTQTMAFFFFGLYRRGLDDLKYYQNEITTVDLKLAALHAAIVISEPEHVMRVIESLVATDRNAQPPVLSEKEHLEHAKAISEVAKTISAIAKA